MTHRRASSPGRRFALFCWWVAFLTTAGFSAAAPKQKFNIPAAQAETSLKMLSAQSGRQVLFPTDAVEGIRTKGVVGEMSAVDALGKMLEGTLLTGIEDEQTGSLTVRRAAPSSSSAPEGAKPAAGSQKKTSFRHRKASH